MEKIKDKKLFVSKADKGGATLIMDYDTVIEIIEKELFDNTKYEILKQKTDAHIYIYIYIYIYIIVKRSPII